MPQNVEPLENLVDQFARFPGIGRKGATRMAYEVMSMSNEQAMELAKAIEHAKKDLHRCRICQDYTAGEVCTHFAGLGISIGKVTVYRQLERLVDSKELRERLAAAGLEWVRRERSWDVVSERILRVYERLLGDA